MLPQRQRRSLSRDEDEGLADQGTGEANYGDEMDRESVDDPGTEDMSGDELEAQRVSRKIRLIP
jgi:hypothetical protein